MEQVLIGCRALSDDTDTEYTSWLGGTLLSVTESSFFQLISTDGIIKHLRVVLGAAPGVGKSYDFTLMLNGAPTALTVHIHDNDTTGSNLVNEIDVTGGDYVTLRVAPTGTPTEVWVYHSSLFEGDTANESLLMGCTGSPDPITIVYNQVYTGGFAFAWNAIEDSSRQVVPTAGTIKNFYVKLNVDPGTDPDAYRFTLRLNGATHANSPIVTITADNTTGNDLVNALDVVAGDVLTLMAEPLNGPAVEPDYVGIGLTFVANIDNESIVPGGSTNDLHNANTEYNSPVTRGNSSWTAEATVQKLTQECTWKKLHILLSAPPGVGNTYTFTLRAAGADTDVVAVVTGAATTGNSGALTDNVADDDLSALKVVPDDTPDVADAYWGFVSVYPQEVAPPVGFQPGHLKMTLGLGRMGYDLKTREGKARRRMW